MITGTFPILYFWGRQNEIRIPHHQPSQHDFLWLIKKIRLLLPVNWIRLDFGVVLGEIQLFCGFLELSFCFLLLVGVVQDLVNFFSNCEFEKSQKSQKSQKPHVFCIIYMSWQWIGSFKLAFHSKIRFSKRRQGEQEDAYVNKAQCWTNSTLPTHSSHLSVVIRLPPPSQCLSWPLIFRFQNSRTEKCFASLISLLCFATCFFLPFSAFFPKLLHPPNQIKWIECFSIIPTIFLFFFSFWSNCIGPEFNLLCPSPWLLFFVFSSRPSRCPASRFSGSRRCFSILASEVKETFGFCLHFLILNFTEPNFSELKPIIPPNPTKIREIEKETLGIVGSRFHKENKSTFPLYIHELALKTGFPGHFFFFFLQSALNALLIFCSWLPLFALLLSPESFLLSSFLPEERKKKHSSFPIPPPLHPRPRDSHHDRHLILQIKD